MKQYDKNNNNKTKTEVCRHVLNTQNIRHTKWYWSLTFNKRWCFSIYSLLISRTTYIVQVTKKTVYIQELQIYNECVDLLCSASSDISYHSHLAGVACGIALLTDRVSLQWRHNECDGVSNHQPHDYLLNRLFRRRSKKTSKLRATGLCEGNSPVTGEFPSQRASNAENVSIWWRHHGLRYVYPQEFAFSIAVVIRYQTIQWLYCPWRSHAIPREGRYSSVVP